MKNLVKFIPLFCVAFALAQTPPPPPPEAPETPPPPPTMKKEMMLERLTKTLELTSEQVAQIKSIDASFENEEEAINSQIKALHEKKKEIMKAKKKEIDKILTFEQKEKLQELKAERRKNKGKKYHDNHQ